MSQKKLEPGARKVGERDPHRSPCGRKGQADVCPPAVLEGLEQRLLLSYTFTYNPVTHIASVVGTAAADSLTILPIGGLLEHSVNGSPFDSNWSGLAVPAAVTEAVDITLSSGNGSSLTLGDLTSPASNIFAVINLGSVVTPANNSLIIDDRASVHAAGTYDFYNTLGAITGPGGSTGGINFTSFGPIHSYLIEGGPAGNTYNIHSTFNSTTVSNTIIGGAGNDAVNVLGDVSPAIGTPLSIDLGGGTNTVHVGNGNAGATVLAPVTVTDTGGTTSLFLDDQSDATHGTATLDNLSGNSDAPFEVTGLSGGAIRFSPTVTALNIGGGTFGGGGVTYNINNTQVGTTTTITGGANQNYINLCNTAEHAGLDNLPGPVVVHGGASHADVVTLNESWSNFNDNYTVTATTVGRIVFGGLTYDGNIGTLTLNAENVMGTNGNNTINISSTADSITTNVNGQGGADTININNTGVSGVLNVNTGSDDGSTVNVLANNEPVNIASGAMATVNIGSTGGPGSMANIQGAISVSNPPSFTVLNFHDENDATGRTWTLDNDDGSDTGGVAVTGLATTAYHPDDLDSLTINGGSGGNTLDANRTSSSFQTTLNTGTGNDTVAVFADGFNTLNIHGQAGQDRVTLGGHAVAPFGMQDFHGTVNVDNTFGFTDLVLDDSSDTASRVANLFDDGTNGQVTGLAPVPINYTDSDFSSLTVKGGSGGNAFTVNGTLDNLFIGNVPTTLNSGSGDDTVHVVAAAGSSTLNINGQAGSDTLNVDYTSDNPVPAGGIHYDGGPGANSLVVTGGIFTTVTENFTNATDGSVVLDDSGTTDTISYTNLSPVLLNYDSADDFVFNLPAAASHAVLKDDGTPANGLSLLHSNNGTFEDTTFATPTNSLTIHRGNAADTLGTTSLPDFTAGLTVGTVGQPLGTFTASNAMNLNTGAANLSVYAGTINLNGGTIDTTNSQTFTGAVVLGANTTLTTHGGDITFTGDTESSSAAGWTLSLNAGSGNVTLGPVGQNPTGYLGGLSVTTGTPMTITSSIVATGDIEFDLTGGNDLTIQSAATIQSTAGRVEFNAVGVHTYLAATGAVLTTQGFNAAGLTLTPTLNFAPALGSHLMLVDNTAVPAGENPIIGAFTNLAQGATISVSFGPANYLLRADYRGGDGNDLVLTVLAGTATVVTASSNPSAYGQSVTFTATVTPVSGGGETGTVQFKIDGSIVGGPVALSGNTATYTIGSLHAGSHSVVAVYSGDDSFIGSTSATLTQNVTPASLTITANNKIKTYGAALPTLTVSYAGFINGDTSASLVMPPVLSTTATATSHVVGNPYSITVGGAVDPDYTISYVSGTLTVTPAPLTITANNQTKVYGAAVPTLTVSYSAFANGDTPANLAKLPALSTTATAASHVLGSPYSITAGGAAAQDYSISYVAGALTVTPVPLTITADNKWKAYGATVPTLTAGYAGLVNGDTPANLTTLPTLTTTATASSPLSGNPYGITVGGAVDPDYTIDYVSGTLTVDPAFGNVPGHGRVTLRAVDPATGHTGVFYILGPGEGSLRNLGTYWDMELTGTTRATTVVVSGAVSLEQIHATSMVGAISASQANFVAVAGDEASSLMDFVGGLLSLTMHDSTALTAPGHNVTIGASATATDAVSIKFHNANDLNVQSRMPIKSFWAASYIAHAGSLTGTPSIHSTGYIGGVVITGNFEGVSGTAIPEIAADSANSASGLGIAHILVTGKMVSSEFHAGGGISGGGIGSVIVGGGLSDHSLVTVETGNIGSVWIGGNVQDDSGVTITGVGNIASVYIRGSLGNSSSVEVGLGSIGPVTIFGSLNNGAKIKADYGEVGSVFVGKNMDNSTVNGAEGVGNVWVCGNFNNGAAIKSDAAIKSVTVFGASLGTSSNPTQIIAQTTIGAVSIGGKTTYANLTSGNSIDSISVRGLMQHGLVSLSNGGRIGSISVGQLDATTIDTRGDSAPRPPVGNASDFPTTNSSIGSMVVRGIKTNGVWNYMTGDSDILAWQIGNLAFSGPSAGGSDLVEYHAGRLVNLPAEVIRKVV